MASLRQALATHVSLFREEVDFWEGMRINILPLSIGTLPIILPVCPFIANGYILSLYLKFNNHTGSKEYSALTSSWLVVIFTFLRVVYVAVAFNSLSIVVSILFFALSYTSSAFWSYYSAKNPDKYDGANSTMLE